MCTCNGAAWLREQLDSIAAQSRLPDHVVISDDASTDGTWPLLEAWQAAMAGRVRVTLLRNDPRVGIVRNFEAATRARPGAAAAPTGNRGCSSAAATRSSCSRGRADAR